MPFLKFSRDKRGYEHFYLVESGSRPKARTRLIYWFRTPPNVKIGRTPFDPDMRRALEVQNPDVAFDWDAIVRTPIPPPSDTERWRERRRAERAMRSEADAESVEADAAPPQPGDRPEPALRDVEAVVEPAPERAVAIVGGERPEPDAATEASGASNPSSSGGGPPGAGRRRRRRRRGRKPQAQGEV